MFLIKYLNARKRKEKKDKKEDPKRDKKKMLKSMKGKDLYFIF